MNGKKWFLGALSLVLAGLLLMIGLVAAVDPFFHYHAPLKGLAYPLRDPRYQNDGILKHYSYDAVITGTSMTENFKASEFDALFDARTVKVPLSGGSFREVNDSLERAFAANDGIRYVVRSLDMYRLVEDKDNLTYDDYPEYLYDDALYNDVEYVVNKEVLLRSLEVLKLTLAGETGTSFDSYCNWMSAFTFGRDAVMADYDRPAWRESSGPMRPEEVETLMGNLTQNVTELAAAHPETEFYLFFPPYTVVWWDSLRQSGTLERQLDIYERTAETLLRLDNIRLFSFCGNFELVTDLEHYKDYTHYDETVSSMILRWMREGAYEVTPENWPEHFRRIRDFYTTYDYDALFA